MMQETRTIGSGADIGPGTYLTNRSLMVLLALTGSQRFDVRALRTWTKLTPSRFASLFSWLQREYLVDVVSTLEGDQVTEAVELTDKGERVLVTLLEQMCELPEFH